MATPAVPKPTKLKGSFDVQYQDKNGAWKTATAKKAFVVEKLEEFSDIDVPVVAEDGKTSKVKRIFQRKLVKTVEEAIELLQNPETVWITMAGLNYVFDLYARGAIKGPIALEEEGPGKAIAKLADEIQKSFEKRGKKLSDARALQMATEMHKAEMEAEDDEDAETETEEVSDEEENSVVE